MLAKIGYWLFVGALALLVAFGVPVALALSVAGAATFGPTPQEYIGTKGLNGEICWYDSAIERCRLDPAVHHLPIEAPPKVDKTDDE